MRESNQKPNVRAGCKWMLQLLARCSMAGHGLTKSNWAAFVCDFLKPKMGSKNWQGTARGVWAGGLEVALRVINKVFVG